MAVELVVITPEEISAYVDGELSPEERRDVAACLRDDERAACLLTAWQWQLGLLHAAFGHIVDEPPPERLKRSSARRDVGRRNNSVESALLDGRNESGRARGGAE